MNELVMRGDIVVVPRPEGGCNLLLAGGNDLIHRKPLEPEEKARLLHELSLTDEELGVEQARRRGAAQIVVPNGTV